MEEYKINQMTIRNERVLNNLVAFLNRIEAFPGHDENMKVRVFVSIERDFILMEACSYALSFLSNDHKAAELFASPYTPAIMTFHDFREKVLSIAELAPLGD